MKSRSKIRFPKPEIPLVNGNGKPPLTVEQFVKKWGGVFKDEPEFWEEVRKARGCNCHLRLNPGRRPIEAILDDCVLLPVSFDVAKVSARLRAERARAGRPMEPADAWIAATALALDLPLFTHDHDFYGIDGLRLMTLLDRHPVDSHSTTATAEDGNASLKAASILSPPRLLQ